MSPQFGFREHPHTADWELEVWAPDLASLMEQAAKGMYSLAGIKLSEEGRQKRTLVVEAQDPESLLVQFLSDLLWMEEDERLGFDQIELKISREDRYRLEAQLNGATIIGMDKEIKAVTYHNLAVQTTPTGFRVVIVFDV